MALVLLLYDKDFYQRILGLQNAALLDLEKPRQWRLGKKFSGKLWRRCQGQSTIQCDV